MHQKNDCWKHFQQTRSEEDGNSLNGEKEICDGAQEHMDDFSFSDQTMVQDEEDLDSEEDPKEAAEVFPTHSQMVSPEGLQDVLGEGIIPTLPPKDEFRYALYAMLNHPSIPLYIYPSVMRLLNSAITSVNVNLIFSRPFSVCRSTTKAEIEKHFPVPKARSIPFRLETKDEGMKDSSLVVFDVKETILQEVQNPDLWHLGNLALKGNRWFQHQPQSDGEGMVDFSDAISGKAYARAYKNHITDPNKELLVPFVAWIDESGVTGNLRHPVQPLLVKCLLLKKALQRYCPLSYIPCGTKSAAENKQDSSSEVSRGINTRNFHAALSVVFREWDETAAWFAENPQQVTLGRSTAEMVIKPVILCFLGDHKSQLMLSCFYSNSTCSECQMVNTWSADDHLEKLNKLVNTRDIRQCNMELKSLETQRESLEEKMAEGSSSGKKSVRKELSIVVNQHGKAKKKLKTFHVIPCDNAFSSFKHIARPINHCSPADHLHVFLLGILKTCATCTIGSFTDKQKKGLDKIARLLFQSNSSSARRLFPRFYIEKGMTNTGHLTGSEWVGFYFALLIVGLTRKGKTLLEASLSSHYQKTKIVATQKIQVLEKSIEECKEESKEGPNNMMNKSKVVYLRNFVDQGEDACYTEFMECVQQMLVLHAFVSQKKFWWSESVARSFDKSLRNLMRQIVFCFPRVEGDCHKYPKMHLLKHLTGSIGEYGAPNNFDCMDGEKALQEFAKHLARTVKSVSDLTYFNQLLARRLEEHLSMKKMLKVLTNQSTPFLREVQNMMHHRQNSSFEEEENEEDQEQEECLAHLPRERNKVIGLPERPHWCARYKIESVTDVSTGSVLEDRGCNICRLVQTNMQVFSQKKKGIHPNSSGQKTIPRVCQRALEKDLVQWFQDVSSTKKWKNYLPNSENQEEIVLHGYFSCKVSRGEQNHLIRCDPNFRGESPRYDFVAEEHCQDDVPRVDKKGIHPQTATPSKVLMLYRNPMDGELRAITHPCEYNVKRGEKVTPVYKTGEVYHLDMSTKPEMQDLLFNELGEIVKLTDFPTECLPPSFLTPICIPETNGTQVTRLGALLFCVQQHPGLLDDADQILSKETTIVGRKQKTKLLSWVLCLRNFREHWPSWFCKSSPN